MIHLRAPIDGSLLFFLGGLAQLAGELGHFLFEIRVEFVHGDAAVRLVTERIGRAL